jgi:hypothetical protein
MTQEKGGALILSSLTDRPLVPSGSNMLAKDYRIDNLDFPATWTLEDFEELGERGRQMDWLEKNLPEIKARLLQVIRGQVSWEKVKSELIAEGFKGASDIKQSTINALIAEQRHNAKVAQQDYRLTANTKKFGEETTATNAHTDALIEFDLKTLRARYAQIIEQKNQEDPNLQALIADWEKARKENDFEAASMLLKYGTAARSHPKFPGSRAMGGSSRQQAVFGAGSFGDRQPQYRDQLKVELNGNVAGALNRVANRTGTGIKKLKNFFFGGG